MDSDLWSGQVDNVVQGCVGSLCRKTAHSISSKQSQVIALHQVKKKNDFNAMQRKGLMAGYGAIWTLEHSPAHAVITLNDPWQFSAVRTFCLSQKITKSIMSNNLIQKSCSKFQPFGKSILRLA